MKITPEMIISPPKVYCDECKYAGLFLGDRSRDFCEHSDSSYKGQPYGMMKTVRNSDGRCLLYRSSLWTRIKKLLKIKRKKLRYKHPREYPLEDYKPRKKPI